MSFPFYIAKRYLLSKKSQNAINIISWVSVLGVSIAAMALVIVLSAFNGLEDLVESLYANFDPDLKVTVKEGKTFPSDKFPGDEIKELEGVRYYTETVEEVALLKYKKRQAIATIKGVEEDFAKMSGVDSMVVAGDYLLKDGEVDYAVLGYGISDKLSLFPGRSNFATIQVYVPKKGHRTTLNPERAFNKKPLVPAGVFSINPDFDTKYIIVPIRFARDILNTEGRVSAVELGLHKGANAMDVKEQVQKILGDKYEVKTRYELNELIFKTNKTEKWVTFLILTFILVIAAFNIIASLTMLIIDKKKDIWILKSMGASTSDVRKIFFTEGMMINLGGAGIGIILGALICWLQQTVGLLRLEGGLVEFYPIKLELLDMVYILLIVFLIGFFASWYPVRVLTKRFNQATSLE